MLANKTFFVCGPKLTRLFSWTRGNRCRSHFFQIMDTWIHSRDIRDQSRQLSKIAPNFGSFFDLPNYRGGLPKVIPKLWPLPHGTSYGKSFMRILPLTRKLYGLIRWILGQIIHFRDKKFYGEAPSLFGCALASIGQSVARIKIWEAESDWLMIWTYIL